MDTIVISLRVVYQDLPLSVPSEWSPKTYPRQSPKSCPPKLTLVSSQGMVHQRPGACSVCRPSPEQPVELVVFVDVGVVAQPALEVAPAPRRASARRPGHVIHSDDCVVSCVVVTRFQHNLTAGGNRRERWLAGHEQSVQLNSNFD